MTNYTDYNIPDAFKKTVKEEHVRRWIASELDENRQPTEEQVRAEYANVTPEEYEQYKMVSYTKNVTSSEVPVPVVISGTWTAQTKNTDRVVISGEVTLTSKVDCYSIEFLSGGHLTINGGARLRIWEGGIVNEDCETVNYLTITSDANYRGELLLHPTTTYNVLINYILFSKSYTNGSSYPWFNFGYNLNSIISIDRIKDSTVGTQQKYYSDNNVWTSVSVPELQNVLKLCMNVAIASNNTNQQNNVKYKFLGLYNVNNRILSMNKYEYVSSSFLGNVKLKNLLLSAEKQNISIRDVNSWDFTTQTFKTLTNNFIIRPFDDIQPYFNSQCNFTLNYKDLVWDPSFEEEVQAPLLTTMSAPMMTTSSPSTNDELPIPAAPSMIDHEMIFED